MNLRTIARAVAAASLFIGLGCGASAAGPSDFLAAFAGHWSGQGTARENPLAQMHDIRCSLSATFDSGSATLKTSGKCATTQGARALDGTMHAAAGSINGDLLGMRPNEQVISQSAGLQGDTLVSELSVQDLRRRQAGARAHQSRQADRRPFHRPQPAL